MAMVSMKQHVQSCSWASPGLHCCSMAEQDLQDLNPPKCCRRVHSIPMLCAPLLEHVSTHVQKELHALRTPAHTFFAVVTVYGSVIEDSVFRNNSESKLALKMLQSKAKLERKLLAASRYPDMQANFSGDCPSPLG